MTDIISDEKLAEFRAGLEGLEADLPFFVVQCPGTSGRLDTGSGRLCRCGDDAGAGVRPRVIAASRASPSSCQRWFTCAAR